MGAIVVHVNILQIPHLYRSTTS